MSAILDDDEEVLAGNTGEHTLCTSGVGRIAPDGEIRTAWLVSARKLTVKAITS
jgi:hypothetical protein